MKLLKSVSSIERSLRNWVQSRNPNLERCCSGVVMPRLRVWGVHRAGDCWGSRHWPSSNRAAAVSISKCFGGNFGAVVFRAVCRCYKIPFPHKNGCSIMESFLIPRPEQWFRFKKYGHHIRYLFPKSHCRGRKTLTGFGENVVGSCQTHPPLHPFVSGGGSPALKR